MTTEVGFEKATPQNLPLVDFDMYLKYIHENECFTSAEMRGVKTDRSTRPSYGDEAIGFVQVKRLRQKCTVKAKVCPEHKVRGQLYNVTVQIDEETELIESANCHSCAASLGGCKHVAAVLKWLHRRSEEPSATSGNCYWVRPKLAKVGTTIKCMQITEIAGTSKEDKKQADPSNTFFQNVACKVHDCTFAQHFNVRQKKSCKDLSLHHMCANYVGDKSMYAFLEFASNRQDQKSCKEVAILTKGQIHSPLWYEIRYGRITASRLYEAAHCRTSDDSLVNIIMGGKIKDTAAMERGRSLEIEVLAAFEKTLNQQVKKTGIVLCSNFPMLGASPDGIADDFVLEIKCPTKEKTVSSYHLDGKITPKYKCQIQLQMMLTKKNLVSFVLQIHSLK